MLKDNSVGYDVHGLSSHAEVKIEDSKVIHRNCPACGEDNTKAPSLSYAPSNWPLKRCRSCNMVYLEKAWSLDVLYDEFAWEDSVKVEDKRRDAMRGIGRNISRLSRKRMGLFPRKNAADLIARNALPGNVMDVGSGSGHYLFQLPDCYTPYGVEISTKAVQDSLSAIRERGGNLINKDALNGMKSFQDDFFTGIIMRSFLEHDTTPRAILKEAHRLLRPNGCLIIKVPNYDCLNRKILGKKWCGFRFPEHVNYFTPHSLSRLIKQSGLKIARFSFFDKLPTSDNMWAIATK